MTVRINLTSFISSSGTPEIVAVEDCEVRQMARSNHAHLGLGVCEPRGYLGEYAQRLDAGEAIVFPQDLGARDGVAVTVQAMTTHILYLVTGNESMVTAKGSPLSKSARRRGLQRLLAAVGLDERIAVQGRAL
ncbi:hypothetical protein AXW83_06505 [Bosea sp. PAMC 26642]|nr:hypothetical protein [Bosea sp. PAMC 26642]AMJ59995.1 hypothetical protein AXW83_06505 [Bosea sp. PAMC 26642]